MLKFKRPVLDTATASNEWHFRWSFATLPEGAKPESGSTDGSPPRAFTEDDGRSVAHFFGTPGQYVVKVSFRHQRGGDLRNAEGQLVTIEQTVVVIDPARMGERWTIQSCATKRVARHFGIAIAAPAGCTQPDLESSHPTRRCVRRDRVVISLAQAPSRRACTLRAA